MTKKKLAPHERAAARLYFFNLIMGSHFSTMYEAATSMMPDATILKVIDKLTPEELDYLTTKIEEEK